MAAPAVDRVTPMFWGLFSVGGFVVALLLPVFVVMNSLAYPFGLVPAGDVTYDGTLAWIANPLAKLFLILVVGGSLFHAMHRLKYVLFDLGLARIRIVLEPVMYGIAAVGTGAAAYLAFSFP